MDSEAPFVEPGKAKIRQFPIVPTTDLDSIA
jgi:hypothetical protein